MDEDIESIYVFDFALSCTGYERKACNSAMITEQLGFNVVSPFQIALY